jgi:uncharacterized protein with von Willebrand factor type A (vWA) domain
MNQPLKTKGNVRQAVQEFFLSEARNWEKIHKKDLGLTDDDELPPYVHQEYPKVIYDSELIPMEVHNAQEEQQMTGEGYYSTLAEANAAQKAPEENIAAPARSKPQKKAGSTWQPEL